MIVASAAHLIMEYPEMKTAGEVNQVCVHLENSVKKWWKDEGIIPQELLRSWTLSIRTQWNADNLIYTCMHVSDIYIYIYIYIYIDTRGMMQTDVLCVVCMLCQEHKRSITGLTRLDLGIFQEVG